MEKTKDHFFLKLWFDRLLSKSLWRQFLILGAVLVLALGLSYLLLSWSGAEWERFCEEKDLNKWLLPIYLLIDSNALSNLYIGDTGQGNAVHGWMLIASSITFLFGAFVFNGVIIGIITNSIERRVSNYNEGHIHYLKSGHYIIMGYDDMVPSIIAHVFEKDTEAFVLIMSAANAMKIKEKLKRTFNDKQLEHIIINYGHRMSKDYYKDIHVESAEQIYIVGMRSLAAHDAVNVECVDSICSYLMQPEVKERPQRITCVFEDLDTYAAFKTSEIFGKVKELGIEFVPYNYYAGWAKQVFVKHFHKDIDRPGEEIAYPTVFGKGYCAEDKKALTKDDARYVHLVFVGTTNFAVAFAMEAAHILHFPNFIRNKNLRTLITFIDINADKEKDVFISRNRHFFEVQPYYYSDLSQGGEYLPKADRQRTECVFFTPENGYEAYDSDFLDVEFEFIKGDIFSPKIQHVISDWAQDRQGQYLSIFLALSDQRQNFTFGMNMPDEIYDNEIPVFIRQERSDNFVSNLREADERLKANAKVNTYFWVKDGELKKKVLGGRYSNIYPFGMNETAYSADEKSLERAKLINYLYCTMPSDNQFQGLLALDAMPKLRIMEEADKYWRDLSVALKWSNLYNAYTIRIKQASLRAMRGLKMDDISRDTWPLSDDEIKMMACIEHNRWNVEKLLMGFRKPHRYEDKLAVGNELFKDDLERNKKRFIHHDIRPFDRLDDIKKLDEEFSRYIPWIVKMTEEK